ncbi:uncharacterized protein JCM15063_002596 [Sporobolomyces koalae]|uniref:uncharacterized protein n=1 Tax=Sporobolomyces koalae TaxID=500713 RepID=UPI00317B47D6
MSTSPLLPQTNRESPSPRRDAHTTRVSTLHRYRVVVVVSLIATVGLLLLSAASGTSSTGNRRIDQWATAVKNGISMHGSFSTDASDSSPVSPETDGIIKVDMQPATATLDELPGERYIGYLPHSGFHNQRAALQNALYLGALLNRTVLVPPVWIGWPSGLEYYHELVLTWNSQIQLHPALFDLAANVSSDSPLFTPTDFPTTALQFPSYTGLPLSTRLEALALARKLKAQHWQSLGYSMRPDGYPITNRTKEDCKSIEPECRGTFEDTCVAWDKVVGLSEIGASGVVRIKDRWDLRERALLEDGFLAGQLTREDVLVFEDSDKYDFQFVDHPVKRNRRGRPVVPPLITNSTKSNHFVRQVSIPAMRQLPQKLLLIGSLFGHQRVFSEPSLLSPSASKLRVDDRVDPAKLQGQAIYDYIASRMSFSNPSILEPAREIRDLLGGSQGYIGVHARVGDGVFGRMKTENMWELWKRLLSEVLGLEESAVHDEESRVRTIMQQEESVTLVERAQASDEVVTWTLLDEELDEDSTPGHIGSSALPQHVHRSLVSKSPASLLCRSPLRSEPDARLFNTPIYLATDSAAPLTSRALRPFFLSFPCIHLFSEFTELRRVKEMQKLVNAKDGVHLGNLFVPFLEASVASMGKAIVGTKGSTFSAYAETTLHHAFVTDTE